MYPTLLRSYVIYHTPEGMLEGLAVPALLQLCCRLDFFGVESDSRYSLFSYSFKQGPNLSEETSETLCTASLSPLPPVSAPPSRPPGPPPSRPRSLVLWACCQAALHLATQFFAQLTLPLSLPPSLPPSGSGWTQNSRPSLAELKSSTEIGKSSTEIGIGSRDLGREHTQASIPTRPHTHAYYC
jgi:hypothetical protein